MRYSIGLLLVVCSCSMAPSREDLEQADFGTKPDEVTIQQVTRLAFDNILKDPFSAQYQYEPLRRGWMNFGCFAGGLNYGWLFVMRVNAKNSFGGYVGWQRHVWLYRCNERNVPVLIGHSPSPLGGDSAFGFFDN